MTKNAREQNQEEATITIKGKTSKETSRLADTIEAIRGDLRAFVMDSGYRVFLDLLERAFCRPFFDWYNTQHRHGGIAMLTPENVHYGDSNGILRLRHEQMLIAYQNHPERFVNGPPELQTLRQAVWINPPDLINESQHKGV